MTDIVLTDASDPAIIGFLGGDPLMPAGYSAPRSRRDGEQSFLFQIFFPDWHALSGQSLLFFFDELHIDEESVIPNMSTVDKYPKFVNAEVLDLQQKYHTVVIVAAEGLQPNPHLKSPLVRKYMKLIEHAPDKERFGRVASDPFWLLGDETPPPSTRPAIFAFQISEHVLFEKRSGSPRQRQVDYFSTTGISERKSDDYIIFAGNEIYFFVYTDLLNNGAYVCVQNSD